MQVDGELEAEVDWRAGVGGAGVGGAGVQVAAVVGVPYCGRMAHLGALVGTGSVESSSVNLSFKWQFVSLSRLVIRLSSFLTSLLSSATLQIGE